MVLYSLYAIELSREVLAEPRFARQNPGQRADKPCVYVGQTAHAPQERLALHLAGHKSNRFVSRYGLKLRPGLVANHGPFVTRDEAVEAEAALAQRLRRRGFGVWYG
jgi:predicted GIY-YIG superfamily endonuclease